MLKDILLQWEAGGGDYNSKGSWTQLLQHCAAAAARSSQAKPVVHHHRWQNFTELVTQLNLALRGSPTKEYKHAFEKYWTLFWTTGHFHRILHLI